MKVASAEREVAEIVRLCFFVNTLKASGLMLGGGINTGSIGAVCVVAVRNTGAGGFDARARLIGCTGVPNAGEDDGIAALMCFLAVSMPRV